MEKVVHNPAEAEKLIKQQFCFPPFLMMEHAGITLEGGLCLNTPENPCKKILIACGKGNNGGDGLVLARNLLCNNPAGTVIVYCKAVPGPEEGFTAWKMLNAMGVKFYSLEEFLQELCTAEPEDALFDCLYGTGFHGEWKEEDATLVKAMNSAKCLKIACDISSGLQADGTPAVFNGQKLAFKADTTVCMGPYKSAYYSDDGKEYSGIIFKGDLGIPMEIAEKSLETSLFVLTSIDFTYPFRQNCSSHKGNFGHTAVIAGEKSGAAVLSATAALKSGTGLCTIVKTRKSNLEQFKIDSQLMISDTIPANTTCTVIGNGLGKPDSQTLEAFLSWMNSAKKPACVLDADLFSYPDLEGLLERLNGIKASQIVLTPHPKELCSLAKLCGFGDFSVEEVKLEREKLGKVFTKKYPHIVLVMKSANTFIAENGNTYIFTGGAQALSKAGSGDILAGLIAGLMAQGYCARDAAFTGCALLAEGISRNGIENAPACDLENFSLTAEDIFKNLSLKSN